MKTQNQVVALIQNRIVGVQPGIYIAKNDKSSGWKIMAVRNNHRQVGVIRQSGAILAPEALAEKVLQLQEIAGVKLRYAGVLASACYKA